MSGFCVFGVSKSLCKKAADKKQETWEMRDAEPGEKQTRYSFSIGEWAELRDKLAERLFAETDRRTQISPKFDSPKFAQDWIDAAPSEVRLCVIMCRTEKVDKNGGVIIKGGVPAMTWAEYVPAAPPSFGPLVVADQAS